jgi:hypothetical protein
VLDVTTVRDTLAEAGQWHPANLSMSFVPLIPVTGDDDALAGLAGAEEPAASDLRAARVVVMMA